MSFAVLRNGFDCFQGQEQSLNGLNLLYVLTHQKGFSVKGNLSFDADREKDPQVVILGYHKSCFFLLGLDQTSENFLL